MQCGSSDEPDGPENPSQERINIVVNDSQIIEQNNDHTITFDVRLSEVPQQDISFDYETVNGTAEGGKDFVSTTATFDIPAGTRNSSFTIPVLADELNELDETFGLLLSNPKNGFITQTTVNAKIIDNDVAVIDENSAGYETEGTQFGYDLVYHEEFADGTIPVENFNFEIGDGCPNLCGWGNSELQEYSDSPENVYIENGNLVIKAIEENPNQYTSTRITTKGKQEFKFGRIDIRAKLPEGQGIWPALWMLGANIDELGWPACGEIDIMEYLGHETNIVHGTAHWGAQGGGSTFLTGSKSGGPFNQQFHVYTLLWENNELNWYVDEDKFHTLTPGNLTNQAWRFNEPFFFVFNVAVGGLWPGNPDETTQFPQTMEIDYIRVFQEQ